MEKILCTIKESQRGTPGVKMFAYMRLIVVPSLAFHMIP